MTVRTDVLQKDHTPLDSLTDVVISSVSDGQALVYDAATGTWKNGAFSGGGKGEFHIPFFCEGLELAIP